MVENLSSQNLFHFIINVNISKETHNQKLPVINNTKDCYLNMDYEPQNVFNCWKVRKRTDRILCLDLVKQPVSWHSVTKLINKRTALLILNLYFFKLYSSKFNDTYMQLVKIYIKVHVPEHTTLNTILNKRKTTSL